MEEEKGPKGKVEVVDLLAFVESLKNFVSEDVDGPMIKLKVGEMEFDSDEILYRDDPDNLTDATADLLFAVERMAYNETGFHVGYERFTGEILCLNRYTSGIHYPGLPPLSVCQWVVLPDSLELEAISAPEEEYYEEKDEFGDPVLSYCSPDDDFAWQELDAVVRSALEHIKSWEWDAEKRVWRIGDVEYALPKHPIGNANKKYL